MYLFFLPFDRYLIQRLTILRATLRLPTSFSPRRSISSRPPDEAPTESESCRFLRSSHFSLRAEPVFNPQPTSPSASASASVSLPDSEVRRAVIDQLFQQEMRGHLSEACLHSQFYGYRVVPGRPFHATEPDPTPLTPKTT